MDCSYCMNILLTRVPVPGKTKTRLSGLLTHEQCAELQQALILDTVEKLSSTGNPLMLCYSDEAESLPDGAEFCNRFFEEVRRSCCEGCALHIVPQRGDDLGARMHNAIIQAFQLGADSCALTGSDLPYITGGDMQDAACALDDSDVVLGPSNDGGYWLVGVRQPFPELFQGKSYGGSGVFEDAMATCRQHGKSVAILRKAFDLDEPDDYRTLCAKAHQGDPCLGPRTAAMVLSAELKA